MIHEGAGLVAGGSADRIMASKSKKVKGQKQASQDPDTTEGKISKKKEFGEYHEFQSLNPPIWDSDEGEGSQVGVGSAAAGSGGGRRKSGRPNVSGSEQGVEVDGSVTVEGGGKGKKKKLRKGLMPRKPSDRRSTSTSSDPPPIVQEVPQDLPEDHPYPEVLPQPEHDETWKDDYTNKMEDEKQQWEKKREAEMKEQMDAELKRRVEDEKKVFENEKLQWEAEKQQLEKEKEAHIEQLDKEKKKVLQWEKEREAEIKKEVEAEKQQWKKEKEADMKKQLDEEKLQWKKKEAEMEAEKQQWKKEVEARMKEQLDEDKKEVKLQWEKEREAEMKKEVEAKLQKRVTDVEAEKLQWQKEKEALLDTESKRKMGAEKLVWMEEKEAEIKEQLQGRMEAEWEEQRKLKKQAESQIADIKKKHEIILVLKSREIQTKDSDIQTLKKKNSEAVDSLKEMQQRVLDLVMEKRKLQQELEDQHKRELEEIDKQHQLQLQQLEKELSQQYKEEAAAHFQKRMRKLKEEKENLSKRLAAVELELAVASQARGGATQESQLKREDLEKDLEKAREELKKEAAERREVDQMYLNLTNSCKEARGRIQELEQELKFKEERLTQLQAKSEESRQPQVQVDGVTPPPDDLHQRCDVLVKENQKLRLQLVSTIHSSADLIGDIHSGGW